MSPEEFMEKLSALPSLIGWVDEPDRPRKHFKASCHCHKFEYEFDHPPIEGEGSVPIVMCNCSFCVNRGYLFGYVPDKMLKFTKGSMDELSQYHFNSKLTHHLFCPNCGSGIGFELGGVVGINMRMLDDVRLNDILKMQETSARSDGRNYF